MDSFILPSHTVAHFVNENHHLVTKENIKVSSSTSYSTAITMGAYLTWQFSNLGPPGCPKNMK